MDQTKGARKHVHALGPSFFNISSHDSIQLQSPYNTPITGLQFLHRTHKCLYFGVKLGSLEPSIPQVSIGQTIFVTQLH